MGRKYNAYYYEATKESQTATDRYNINKPWYEWSSHIWHGTRGVWEHMSAEQRILQTRAFAWEIIFLSANVNLESIKEGTKEAVALGQALHAFQDIEAHAGSFFPPDDTLKPDGDDHDIYNDLIGETYNAQVNTINALIVHQALNCDFNILNKVLDKNKKWEMNLEGMSSNQKKKF